MNSNASSMKICRDGSTIWISKSVKAAVIKSWFSRSLATTTIADGSEAAYGAIAAIAGPHMLIIIVAMGFGQGHAGKKTYL